MCCWLPWDKLGGKLIACIVHVAKAVCRASYYWLGTPPRGNPWMGSPRGGQDLLLGSTGSGCPRLYPASVSPTTALLMDRSPWQSSLGALNHITCQKRIARHRCSTETLHLFGYKDSFCEEDLKWPCVRGMGSQFFSRGGSVWPWSPPVLIRNASVASPDGVGIPVTSCTLLRYRGNY